VSVCCEAIGPQTRALRSQRQPRIAALGQCGQRHRSVARVRGLAFDVLSGENETVFTGHDDGLVTLPLIGLRRRRPTGAYLAVSERFLEQRDELDIGGRCRPAGECVEPVGLVGLGPAWSGLGREGMGSPDEAGLDWRRTRCHPVGNSAVLLHLGDDAPPHHCCVAPFRADDDRVAACTARACVDRNGPSRTPGNGYSRLAEPVPRTD